MEDISYIISGQRVETDFQLSASQMKVFWHAWEHLRKNMHFEEEYASREDVIDYVLDNYPYQASHPAIDWSGFEGLTWLQKQEVLKQVFTADMYQIFNSPSKQSCS